MGSKTNKLTTNQILIYKSKKSLIMKNFLFLIAFLFFSAVSFAQVSVSGYYRSNGTYVQPYQRTYPNATRNDNYSTIGNVNPYTGKAGTQPRDSYTSTRSTYTAPSYSNTYSAPTYSSSSTVYTGSRGGQYYINSSGNKTYVSY